MGRKGIHTSFSDQIVLSPITPLTSGGTLDLADGQIGLFQDIPTQRGLKAVSSLTNVKGKSKFYLEVGTGINSNAGGYTSKGMRSVPFTPKDILEITHGKAKEAKQSKVILGYDGFDSSKTINLDAGTSTQIHIKLVGDPLAFYGFKDGVFEKAFAFSQPTIDDCEDNCSEQPCYDVVKAVKEKIDNYQVREGILLKDLINVRLISDCSDQPTPTTTADFYCITVCDQGDDAALGLIQAQVSGYQVVRTDRKGQDSSYQVVVTDGSTPSDYTQWSANLKTNCAGDCPTGYSLVEGGFLYSIAVEDDGSVIDFTAIVLSSGTSIDTSAKVGQSFGTGKYNIITDALLVQADIDEIIVAQPTVKIDEEYVEIEDACVLDTPITVSWEACGQCDIAEQLYYIDLNDTECGDSRLQELQEAFPSLTIVEQAAGSIVNSTNDAPTGTGITAGSYTGIASSSTSGSGTGATWNIVVNADGDVVSVVSNAKGTGYAAGDTITIAGNEGALDGATTDDDITITITSVGIAPANCRRRYHTTVISEMVCEECYRDLYNFEAPLDFEFERWYAIEPTATGTDSPDCKCGLYFEGKDLELCPPKQIADQIGVVNGQIKIHVSGGELLGNKIGYDYNESIFPVTRIERAFDGTGWGYNYMYGEKTSYDRFLSVPSGKSYAETWFKGNQTKLEPCEQYDTITVKVKRTKSAQGFTKQDQEFFRYIFVIPQGSKDIFEGFFNSLTGGNPDANGI